MNLNSAPSVHQSTAKTSFRPFDSQSQRGRVFGTACQCLQKPRSGTAAEQRIAADPVTQPTGCRDTAEPCTLSRSSLLHAVAALLPCALTSQLSPAMADIIEEDAAERIYVSAGPSVVAVHTRAKSGNEEGLGSGFVWDTRGHIVSNFHVIAKVVTTNTQALTVSLSDAAGKRSQEYPAIVLGTDADHDLAVLKIDASADVLRPISVGQSGLLRVGQAVFAIGSPFGYSKSLTTGIVSGINRTIASPVGTVIKGAIQTDASISAGNSGGPLLDSSGRLVGINTSSFTRLGTGRSSGVNFALPIDLALSIVPNLIVSGTNRRAA